MTHEQSEKFKRGLALFDFDGTLIPWDTQVIFANHVLKQESWRRFYLPIFTAFAPLYKILGDEGMKRVFLSYLWKSKPEEVRAWATEFVFKWIPERCYSEVIDKLEQHKAAGHLTVLASASPDFYVSQVGKALGFDLAFGTPVEMQNPMPLFPDLENHKGEVKVRRLSAIVGLPGNKGWANSHGYTDSTADLPMMMACREGTVVNPSSRLSLIAAKQGWEVLRPDVPWKNSNDKKRQIACFAAGL